MRKHILIAGMLIAAACVLAVPSQADTVNFSLSGQAIGTATFSLPDTFTPSVTLNSIAFVFSPCSVSAPCTLLGQPLANYGTIDLGNSGPGAWSFGSTGHTMNNITFPGPELGVFVAGLFIVNPDGTITVNSGTWTLANLTGAQITLTTTVIPGPVSTPEPATLALLGIGGLALAGLRRRKAA